MTRVVRSTRRWAAVAALILFNVLAVAVLASADAPTPPLLFVGWFVGDAIIGLATLAASES